MNAPLILRGVLFATLLLALAAGARYDARDASVVRLRGDWHRSPGTWAARAQPGGRVLVVRSTSAPPDGAELEALAALAATAPLLAARPRAPALALHVDASQHLLVGRSAALGFDVRGSADAELLVRLHDAAGPIDSTRVVLDSLGRSAGAFRLRPLRAGWQEWRVEAAAASRTAGAWVAAAPPPRVLVAAGPPDWESRFVLRALEEAGTEAFAALPLGRGLQAGSAGPRSFADSAALAGYGAVIVLPGAAVAAGERRALVRFVADGGGLLAVARADLWGELGLGLAGEALDVEAATLRWRAPPELAPLPAADLRVAALPLEEPSAAVHVAASDADRALLALASHGFGRVAALGLSETWRWRLEAGRVDEHREFWRGLVDWLEPASPPQPRVRLAATRGPVGRTVAVAIEATASPAPALLRPDGSSAALAAAGVTAFLPLDTGVYRIVGADGVVRAAFRAIADEPAAGDDAVARLALLAHASGGALVAADSVEPRIAAWRIAQGAPGDGAWRWLLLFALLGAATAEWLLRRLRGRP